MKKSLLLIASVVMSTVAAFAQWTRPVPAFEPMADDGETVQYMYNVEFGGFFLGGNDWNTRASVSASKGYKVKITAQYEDEEKTVPLNTWAIMDSVETQSAWKATFCENPQSIWVDNNSGANWDKWIITSIGDNMYEITNPDAGEGKLGATEVYEGATGNTRLWLLDYSIVDAEEAPIMSGTAYTTWAFVSPDEYTAWVDKMAQYTAAVTLGNYIETSEEECPGIDLSAAKLVYGNTESTPEELAQALADAKEIVNTWKSSQATATDPKDVSDFIENGTFDVIGNFTGWKGTSFGAGGTTSTCAEHYSKNYDTYQDVNGGEDIPNGIYKVSVVGFYRAGSIANDWATRDDASYRYAKMYAKSGEDSLYVSVPSLSSWAAPSNIGGVATGDNNDLFVPNSMAQFTTFKEADYGHAISVFVPVEDNKLRIGVVKTTLLDTDWSIFDDFTLTYYGDADDAYQLWRDEMVEAAEADFTSALDNATFYYKAAVTDFNNYLELAKGATAKEDIKTYVEGIQSVSEEALASIKAYQDYFDRLEEIREYFAEHDDLVGDDVDIITDFIADGADAEQILEAGELDTEGITAALATLNEMFDAALRSGAAEGTDMTNLLINPSFKTGDFTGWTYKAGKTGKENVECYESVVDVYQTVENVPAGLYAISVQAFERPGGNGSYTGDEEPNVFLFMNDFQTPVQNIVKDAISAENAVHMENCYLSNPTDVTTDGTWPYDYEVADKGFVPNSIDGAYYAFKGGRYTQTCYGLVNEDGKMTIGLTSNGKTLGTAGWVLFANFKLTYMEKNVEALQSVLGDLTEKLNDYINNNELNELGLGVAEYAIGEAEDVAGSDDPDELWANVVAINQATVDARANVEAYAAFNETLSTLDDTYNEFADEAAESAKQAYEEVMEKAGNVEKLTTEEINELVVEMKDAIGALKVPAYEDATDENPVDMTRLIVNSTFDTVGDFTGWSSGFGAGGTTSTCAECYNKLFDVYQDLKGLPAGTYQVAVCGFYRQGSIDNDYQATVAGTATPAYNAYLYAIGETTEEKTDTAACPIMSLSAGRTTEITGASTGQNEYVPNSMADFTTWKDAGYYAPVENQFNSVFVKVGEEGTLRIGVKKEVGIDTDWAIFDDFTLLYYGNESTKELTTEVTAVNVPVAAAPSAIYSIAGARLNGLQKGLNIVKFSNGTVKKVFVK